jgi:LmbE family N-acetylglucosaminyl deacetylase
MLHLQLPLEKSTRIQVLCLGAHADDIEIGCGGTILRLASEYARLAVHWVVCAGHGERGVEALASAERFLADVSEKQVQVEEFRDGYFPYVGAAIKDYFESLKEQVRPDVIFTHYRGDAHQDHRLLCELTWNTFRNHFILEYEVPKYDGDLGAPNLFVHLPRETAGRKVNLTLAGFPSQRGRDWFTEDALRALLRLRGVESKAEDGYAEAFYARKIAL